MQGNAKNLSGLTTEFVNTQATPSEVVSFAACTLQRLERRTRVSARPAVARGMSILLRKGCSLGAEGWERHGSPNCKLVRLEVAHDFLRGVGKGFQDAHKQAWLVSSCSEPQTDSIL